jgi:hypothetical protein
MTTDEAMTALNASVSSLTARKRKLFQAWLDLQASCDPSARDEVSCGLIQSLITGDMRVCDIKTLEEGPLFQLTEKGQEMAARALCTSQDARDMWNALCAANGKGEPIMDPPNRKQ